MCGRSLKMGIQISGVAGSIRSDSIFTLEPVNNGLDSSEMGNQPLL